jgi:hypothetical protein
MKPHLVGTPILLIILVCSALCPQVVGAADADAALSDFIYALNISMPPRTDVSPLVNAYAENGVHHGVNQGPPQVGREQIGAFFGGFKDRWAHLTHTGKSRLTQGNRAMWEGVAEGLDKLTGKPVKLPIVFIIDFDYQGKVREQRTYIDVHLRAEQLE